jgi:hypothetical protein
MILSGISISGGGLSLQIPGAGPQPVFGGTSYGYTGTSSVPAITRYPYASDANATGVGSLQSPGMGRCSNPGQASETNGYLAGSTAISSVSERRWIQKYSYATGTQNATVTALLTNAGKYDTGGASSKSQGYGYVLGGDTGNPSNTFEKFSFSADTNAVAVGVLDGFTGGYNLGFSSPTNGYSSAGTSIRKFPFATDSNAVVSATNSMSAAYFSNSSETNGFISGSGQDVVEIKRFSFTSDTNAANVASLVRPTTGGSATSSTSYGYQQGGYGGYDAGWVATIQKFPYVALGTSTTVGNLTPGGSYRMSCGTQV